MWEVAHLMRTPFEQRPTLQDGKVTLFETGAIVANIAQALFRAQPLVRPRLNLAGHVAWGRAMATFSACLCRGIGGILRSAWHRGAVWQRL